MLSFGCASPPLKAENDDASNAINTELHAYQDFKSEKMNRAPASMVPILSQDGVEKLDPLYLRTQADYYFSMAEAFSLDGDSQKAIENFKLTLVYDKEAAIVNTRLAAEYLKQGMTSEALTQAEEAVEKDPKNIDSRLLLGGLYSSMKLYDRAMEQYQAVIQQDPKNLEAPLYIGAIYSEKQEYDKAIKHFESLLKVPEYSTPYLVHYYVGRIHLEQGENFYKKAEESFKLALNKKPDFSEAAMVLGQYYSKTKNSDKMINLYQRFQKENGPQAKMAEVLAQYYLEKNDLDSAYEQLEIIEENSEENLGTRMKMALILIEKKMYDKASHRLESILMEAPESDKIRFYLAAVYEEMKEFDKALIHFAKVPVYSQFYVESVIHSAYILKQKDKLPNAISIVEGAIANKKDQPQLHTTLASLYDDKGELDKAKLILENAILNFPENTQLKFYYGTIVDKSGNKPLVIEVMKKVIEIDSKHSQALNYLAYTWAELGENLAEAEDLARRAVKLEPKDPYVMDTLGWVLFKRNKFDESIKILEVAYKTQGNISIIAEHLGDVYYKKSMPEKAIKMYQKAAELEKDEAKINDLKSKISAIQIQDFKWNKDEPRKPASSSK